MPDNGPADGATIVIAGAGISGLATALAIQDRCRDQGLPPPRLRVVEPEPHVGGKIRTIAKDGFTCEWGVNGFLNKEPRTIELCQRLGLEQRLLPAAGAFSRRYIFARGKLRQVQMHPLKFLFSGILPLGAKFRLMREMWVKSRTPEDGDESVADFARRRLGPLAYQTLVDPMQTGIFAGDPEQMSVVSCFPRVVEVERDYGSLIRGMARIAKERKQAGVKQTELPGAGPSGHLTSFTGGMQTLVERLAQELGPAVSCSSRLSELRPLAAGKGLQVTIARDGEHEQVAADALVLACPAYAAAQLTEPLAPDLGQTLGDIDYSPLVVCCLGFAREQVAHPMDGFGFLVPRQEGLRLLGALWTSTLFPERAPEGDVLMRVMIGGARDPEVLELSDDQLVQQVLQELRRVHGELGSPKLQLVFRHGRAIPQYRVGHGQRLKQIEGQLAQLPGLFITGNAYRGVGVNDCARNAHLVAEAVVQRLQQRG